MRGYFFQTKFGTAAVSPLNGRWVAVFDGENLGSYASPQQAVDDLVGGHTYSPSSGIDTSEIGLPVDVEDWIWISR